MPRERSPNRDKAFEIYEENKGNIDLVDIAKILNLSDGTVRGWKNKDKWDEKLNRTFQRKSAKNTERSNKNKSNKKVKKEKPKLEEVIEIENSELTDKQRLFCVYYIKLFNATKAYRKAYECSYEVALVNGPRLLGNARVKEEIQRLKLDKLKRAMLSEDDIFQKYIDIAFADITDYVEFGQEEVPVMTIYGPLMDKETYNIERKAHSPLGVGVSGNCLSVTVYLTV